MRFRQRTLFYPLVGLILLGLCSSAAMAADPVVEWTGTFAPDTSRSGEHVTLEVQATVPEKWHLYSMNKVPEGPTPLTLKVEAEGLEPSGDWVGPAPKEEFDPVFKKDLEYFEGTVVHRRSYAVSGATGDRAVTVSVRGQICDPTTCILVTKVLELTLPVGTGDARSEFVSAPTLEGTVYGAKAAEISDADKLDPDKTGLIEFLIASFIAGLLALLTPCVFPMIPVTIAFFTKTAEVSKQRSLLMAGTYSGAIVVCFTLLGVGASVIFGASAMQQTAASIPFNAFMFLLLFLFGLSLMGLFKIQAPRFLLDKSQEMQWKYEGDERPLGQQLLGVFFMGLTFSLMSFTCTVGLVGILFAQLDGGEHWLYPTMGLFMFAVAFALPFFLLALFPAAAQRLQGKGGDWMDALKVTLGFLEVAGAFKFLSNIDLVMGWFMVTRPVVLMLWVALFLGCGLYLWRLIVLVDYETDKHVGVLRMLAGGFFVSFALYSASGFTHTKSMGSWIDAWLPPAVMPDAVAVEGSSGGGEDGHEFNWIKDDIPGALAAGKEADKPVFVDFTGYTCTNCRMMEASMFPRPNIKSRLDQMILGSAYTDCLEPVCTEQQTYQKETFGTVALPFYAVYDPHSGEALETFASSTNDHTEYEVFLQKALDKFKAAQAARQPKAEAEEASHKAEAPPEPKFADVPVTHARQGEANDFELPSLMDGTPYKLSSDRGTWILLNFWASWCAPCKHELEHDFPPTLKAHPHVKVVTVDFDGEDMAPISKAFIEKIKLPNHTALLGGEEPDKAGLPEVFNGAQLPRTYLIDPEGYVVWSRSGSLDQELLGRLLGSAKSP
ncbi:MAG: cytochrome c biogenesis protein CcdA [Myxococcota bacterium]|nr:cytochrome c biogenesis protein CcdA [Myxococcota bacterium]